MSEEKISGVQYFVIIADQKKKDKYIRLLNEQGAKGIETVYAHGSVSPSALRAAFGLDAQQNKAMITCLVKKETAVKLIDTLYTVYHFDKPNTGIAFSIPVEGLAF